MTPTMHCCSNNEAEYLGIFYLEWFQMIQRWNQSQETYEKECANYAEFATNEDSDNPYTFKKYQQIVKVIYKRFYLNLHHCF